MTCRGGMLGLAVIAALPLAEGPLLADAMPEAPAAMAAPAGRQPPQSQPSDQDVLDRHVYEVSALVVRHAFEHPDLPPIEALKNLAIELGEREGVYYSPRAGMTSVNLTLGQLRTPAPEARRLSAGAINTIAAALVSHYNARGFTGVSVFPAPGDIDPQTLADLRPTERRALVLDVHVPTVGQVRTLGSGPRWSRAEAPPGRPSLATRINHPVHERIRRLSPLQVGDLLRRQPVEEYAARLERYGNRRVDAVVAADDRPDRVILDYVVSEDRPWTVALQISNTGTEATSEWRQRLLLTHRQFTGRDDILSLDFITASFDDVNALQAAYDAPLAGSDRWRWRLYGTVQEFTASDVGFPGEDFKGDSWLLGGEVVATVAQRGRLFVDLFAGARWSHVHVTNEPAALEGRDNFFVPYAGVRLERVVRRASTFADVRLETNLADLAETDSDEIVKLGRLSVDEDWVVFKWNVSHAFYPRIFRKPAGDVEPPLVHEVALSTRGQIALGSARLIPQEEEVVGGFASVRGYDESVAAGDSVYLFSAEYRYHLPYGFSPRPAGVLAGMPFRWAPDQPGGRPDWDLVIRAFLDVGRAHVNDALAFESSRTLAGAGVGAEVIVWRNLALRVDWGVALRDAGDTDAGDHRLHVLGTIAY